MRAMVEFDVCVRHFAMTNEMHDENSLRLKGENVCEMKGCYKVSMHRTGVCAKHFVEMYEKGKPTTERTIIIGNLISNSPPQPRCTIPMSETRNEKEQHKMYVKCKCGSIRDVTQERKCKRCYEREITRELDEKFKIIPVVKTYGVTDIAAITQEAIDKYMARQKEKRRAQHNKHHSTHKSRDTEMVKSE
jgi:hypothetical protein